MYRPAAHHDLHSFPTRRSSDLFNQAEVGEPHGHRQLCAAETAVSQDPQRRPRVIREGSTEGAKGTADNKSTRLNCSLRCISYAVLCLTQEVRHPARTVKRRAAQ